MYGMLATPIRSRLHSQSPRTSDSVLPWITTPPYYRALKRSKSRRRRQGAERIYTPYLVYYLLFPCARDGVDVRYCSWSARFSGPFHCSSPSSPALLHCSILLYGLTARIRSVLLLKSMSSLYLVKLSANERHLARCSKHASLFISTVGRPPVARSLASHNPRGVRRIYVCTKYYGYLGRCASLAAFASAIFSMFLH